MSDLKGWRGDVSVFPSEFDTVPSAMREGLGWSGVCDQLAPESGPTLRRQKSQLPFVLPCLLDQSVPYSGKTAERFPAGACGPMRSSAHVESMTATWLIYDLDQSERPEVLAYLRGLRDRNVTFLAYTTYSNGAPEKSGYRVRVAIPIDRAVKAAEYKRLHAAVNAWAFGDKADRTGERMSQQQSVWGCHPDRKALASRLRHDAGVLCVAEVPSYDANPHPKPVRAATGTVAGQSALPTAQRIEQAMPWLIADDGYGSWSSTMMAFAALRGHLGDAVTQDFAQRYHQTSPPESTRARLSHLPQYDPAQVIGKVPTMTAEAAAGYLLGQAKARAVAVLQTWGLGFDQDPEVLRQAVIYLAAFHRGTYEAIRDSLNSDKTEAAH